METARVGGGACDSNPTLSWPGDAMGAMDEKRTDLATFAPPPDVALFATHRGHSAPCRNVSAQLT